MGYPYLTLSPFLIFQDMGFFDSNIITTVDPILNLPISAPFGTNIPSSFLMNGCGTVQSNLSLLYS